MSVITKIPNEITSATVEPPMKEGEFIVLIENLRQMQEKANELAVQQLELTKQLETALKTARELHKKTLIERNDIGGEG
jgi:hypothetical protein